VTVDINKKITFHTFYIYDTSTSSPKKYLKKANDDWNKKREKSNNI